MTILLNIRDWINRNENIIGFPLLAIYFILEIMYSIDQPWLLILILAFFYINNWTLGIEYSGDKTVFKPARDLETWEKVFLISLAGAGLLFIIITYLKSNNLPGNDMDINSTVVTTIIYILFLSFALISIIRGLLLLGKFNKKFAIKKIIFTKSAVVIFNKEKCEIKNDALSWSRVEDEVIQIRDTKNSIHQNIDLAMFKKKTRVKIIWLLDKLTIPEMDRKL